MLLCVLLQSQPINAQCLHSRNMFKRAAGSNIGHGSPHSTVHSVCCPGHKQENASPGIFECLCVKAAVLHGVWWVKGTPLYT